MERKNFFSINVNNKRFVGIDNETFVLRRESAELSAERDRLSEELANALHKTIKKSILRMLPTFVACGLGILLASIAFEMSQAREKFPIVLGFIAGILFVGGIVYTVFNRKNEKMNENKSDAHLEQLNQEYETFNAKAKKELEIPEDAPKVEFFSYMYSPDGKKGTYSSDATNAFVEDGKLCFWYGEAVIGFAMDEIEALVKVNEPITFDSWMPDDPHDSPKYAQYGIEKKEIDYIEQYTMTGYYSLHLTHDEEPFELLFPLFDAEAFLKLIDREIVEE